MASTCTVTLDQAKAVNATFSAPAITTYQYDANGNLTQITDPLGRIRQVQYDALNQPVRQLEPHPTTIGSTLGQIDTTYDSLGQIQSITDPRNLTTSYNVDALDDSDPQLNQRHGYDELDRLTASERGEPVQSRTDYRYDLSGNRTGKTQDNTTVTNGTIDPSSNRLQSQSGAQTVNYSYDSMGSLTTDGTVSYTYNAAGRRLSATTANLNAHYTYNALGQRVTKTVNGSTTQFFYDEKGHLTGEYDSAGHLLQEILWLGELPVAVLKPATGQAVSPDLYYIHADHLGTPRKITRPTDNKVIWTWESEAFGASLPDPNPSGLRTFVFNLRFPGQYYDQETGLFYNGFRDYDPATGRYGESDPIGLAGGLNTYTYVSGNPVNYTDPLGLLVVINGTNPRATSILDEAYRKLKKTKKGKELCEKLENSDEVYTIRNDSPTKLFKNRWFYHDYTKSIVVNVDHLPVVNTVDGPRPSPMEVTLGHEIGHAATGIDDGPSNAQMENVIANENPIRAELKLPARTTYP